MAERQRGCPALTAADRGGNAMPSRLRSPAERADLRSSCSRSATAGPDIERGLMLLNHRTRRIRITFLMIALATFSAASAARAEDVGARASEPAIDHFGGRGQVALDNVVGVT